MTRSGFAAWILKGTNISQERFDTAFESLRNLKYFSEIKLPNTEETGFKLSPFGIDWVEDYYVFSEAGDTLTFNVKHQGMIRIGTRRETYLEGLAVKDAEEKKTFAGINTSAWTKWGAIAAWLAIPIAIILWTFS